MGWENNYGKWKDVLEIELSGGKKCILSLYRFVLRQWVTDWLFYTLSWVPIERKAFEIMTCNFGRTEEKKTNPYTKFQFHSILASRKTSPLVFVHPFPFACWWGKKKHIRINLPEMGFFSIIFIPIFTIISFILLCSLILPQFSHAFLFPASVYSCGFSFGFKLCALLILFHTSQTIFEMEKIKFPYFSRISFFVPFAKTY